MTQYIGTGPYCYANMSSMLLAASGETVPPSLVEVLSGVGLGARRALDYAAFFGRRRPDLELIKGRQAQRVGGAHTMAVRARWPAVAGALEAIADLEDELAAASLSSRSARCAVLTRSTPDASSQSRLASTRYWKRAPS